MLVTERTFSARAERVARATDLTLDLETDGLQPWKGSKLCGVAVEVDGEADYFPFRHEGGWNLPLGLLPKVCHALLANSVEKTYGGWSIRFDLSMLAYEHGHSFLAPYLRTRDGMVDALLLNENEPSFSLAAISERYLGAGAAGTKHVMDELLADRFPKVRSARLRKGMLWKLPAADVAPYACGDVLLPRRLREKYDVALAQWGMTNLCREMNGYSMLLARMQVGGVPIDVDLCRQLSETTEQRKAALLDAIRAEAGPTFNPNSQPQTCRLLKTADAQKETLRRLGSPLAQRIVDYKLLGKAKSAYYDAILELVDDAGVLHPQLNLTRDQTDVGGTRTGRLSCSNPNFQALPHVDEDPNAVYRVRDLVVAPRGMKIAKLDYERAEMWMGASYCREPRLIEAYHQGRDVYSEMSAELKITRQAAKILFLMTQYGAGAWKIALKMGWAEERARDVRTRFFAMYPAIRRAMYAYGDQWSGTGCLRLWTGRACHFDGTTPGYAGWNRVVQGAVGEMIRVAMQRLEGPLAVLGARMILQCHDELVVLYPEENEKPVLATAVDAMTAFDQFLLRPRVDVKVSGKSYADCKGT